MSNNVSTDRLPSIRTSEQSTGTWITLHLVRHEHRQIVLFRRLRQLRKMDVELLLPLAQLAAAGVVDTEECADTVDDEQAVLATGQLLRGLRQSFMLMLGVLGADVGDVLVSGFRIDAEALGDLDDAFGAEGAFGVCITMRQRDPTSFV